MIKGSTYIDDGATAVDDRDGNITANIDTDNPVDTNPEEKGVLPLLLLTMFRMLRVIPQ